MTAATSSTEISRYLLDMYTAKHVNRKRGLASVISELDIQLLVDGYKSLQETAPSRHSRNLSYLVETHDGVPSTGATTTRREEHLALALWNDQSQGFTLPDASGLQLIDYQVPLKARRGDAGIGKLDLLGVVNHSACVIELKVTTPSGHSDSPLRAFLEALAYCAIIEANITDLRVELAEKHGISDIKDTPSLVVIAPRDYWLAWRQTATTGNWWSVLNQVVAELQSLLGLQCWFLALEAAEFQPGFNGTKPRLLKPCSVVSVDGLVGRPDILSPRTSGKGRVVRGGSVDSHELQERTEESFDTSPGKPKQQF